MSEERPAHEPPPKRATDADAWATACAEDLAAEQARRRTEHGPPPGSAAEELRKLVDAVADKLSDLRSPCSAASPDRPPSRWCARSSSRPRPPWNPS